jgi:hypothetical protein
LPASERLSPPEWLASRDVAKFTGLVALLAIIFDASIGHGLTWENDPYWTYRITKTFLIATIFGLGTACFGIGEVRGAVITVVHSLILTVCYWSWLLSGCPPLLIGWISSTPGARACSSTSASSISGT